MSKALKILDAAKLISMSEFGKELKDTDSSQLHTALSRAVMSNIAMDWKKSREKHQNTRCAYYFSAEFLVGRAIFNNLLCLDVLNDLQKLLNDEGISIKSLEEAEDAALGNGGLGRLAACFLDSGATLNLPLSGYGIRYKYGLFKQRIEDGFQKELVDDWTHYGDPWSVRRDEDAIKIKFGSQSVFAVPYDMPIVGYDTDNIVTLRLWQAEPVEAFDFELFNNQSYTAALKGKNRAEDISRVLYPNDSTNEGKLLRLKQQYFFSSASIQDIIKNYKVKYDNDFSRFSSVVAIQLNDTHPVIAIPELIRILVDIEGLNFDTAMDIAKETFSYTNHTVMLEALEKWDIKIIRKISLRIVQIMRQIDLKLKKELKMKQVPKEKAESMQIIQNGTVHMAYLAVYLSGYINGVAKIHSEILKSNLLADWYSIYPDKFQNKTNGITQRRWLGISNPELSDLISELLGTNRWLKNLDLLKNLEKFKDDENVLNRFIEIKSKKHRDLCRYVQQKDLIQIDPETIFDVQIKRLHEYKRQLLNIMAILELYFEIKDGTLDDFVPTTFIFGAKAAPGYFRAKAVIKLINEVAKLIDSDSAVNKFIKVVFISNYNVSYAEKIVSAADVSEQISTAGTEASGTGNMKLMLNGAVTLGTFDGATVEIVEEAGLENNYIFGATIEEIERLKPSYKPINIYNSNPGVRRVLDALTDGTLDDNSTGMFSELYNSLIKSESRGNPDYFFVLHDFDDYLRTKIQINNDYKNKINFAKKCWINICNSGKFSSDRTVNEYANEIWHIEKL